jgi:hypothetical protein
MPPRLAIARHAGKNKRAPHLKRREMKPVMSRWLPEPEEEEFNQR